MAINKYSRAKKLWWATIPKAKRSKMMRELALKKHAALSPEQRRKHALKMVKARFSKKK